MNFGGQIRGLLDYLGHSVYRVWWPWRKDRGGQRQELEPLNINALIHRQGVVTAFVSNVLGADGIMPLYRDSSDHRPAAKLARIRQAKRSWSTQAVNDRGDTPWTLQCQALASLVDYGLALIHHPPQSHLYYVLDVGGINYDDSSDQGYRWGSRDYLKEEVIRLEIPSHVGRYVNSFEATETLKAAYELQGQAYVGFAGLLGLLGTLWQKRSDMPEAESSAFRQAGAKEQLKGARVVSIPSNAPMPQILDLKADTAAMEAANAVTTQYKSSAYGLSGLAFDRDYSALNYSAGLLAVRQDGKIYDIYAGLMRTLVEAIYETWDDVGAKAMMIDWTEPAIPVLDPVRYASSMEKLEKLGAVSQQEIIRGRGRDPEEVFLERAMEQEAGWQSQTA